MISRFIQRRLFKHALASVLIGVVFTMSSGLYHIEGAIFAAAVFGGAMNALGYLPLLIGTTLYFKSITYVQRLRLALICLLIGCSFWLAVSPMLDDVLFLGIIPIGGLIVGALCITLMEWLIQEPADQSSGSAKAL